MTPTVDGLSLTASKTVSLITHNIAKDPNKATHAANDIHSWQHFQTHNSDRSRYLLRNIIIYPPTDTFCQPLVQ